MATYYIGADVHSHNTELATGQRDKIVDSYSVPTTIPAISTVLDSLHGKKLFAMEEVPRAGWLYRNLHEKVEQFIVSEPRRNKLITCDGDKDDKIDAHKLAVLLRGKFLKAFHHTNDSYRAHLKHWVNLYHDRARDAVRNINKVRVCCGMHGVASGESSAWSNLSRTCPCIFYRTSYRKNDTKEAVKKTSPYDF